MGAKGAQAPPIFGTTKTSVFSTNTQIVLDRVLEYMIACNLPYVNVTSNSTTDTIHITWYAAWQNKGARCGREKRWRQQGQRNGKGWNSNINLNVSLAENVLVLLLFVLWVFGNELLSIFLLIFCLISVENLIKSLCIGILEF